MSRPDSFLQAGVAAWKERTLGYARLGMGEAAGSCAGAVLLHVAFERLGGGRTELAAHDGDDPAAVPDVAAEELRRGIDDPWAGQDLGALGPQALGALVEAWRSHTLQLGPTPTIERGDGRRRTGTHYTPRDLADDLVERTLSPLGRRDVVVCDPAMGGGVFLLSAVAWLQAHGGASAMAGRVCGIDRDALAVMAARLSLRLVLGDAPDTITALTRGLRCGDALLGASAADLEAFHWQHDARTAVLDPIAFADPQRARFVGDLLLAVFFAHDLARDRESDRRATLTVLEDWVRAGAAWPPPQSLLARAQAFRRERRPLHWAYELPQAGRVDAFVGNPPFMGGRNVSETLGERYSQWLQLRYGGGRAADLVARFFIKAWREVGSPGTVGLFACDTIAHGDTRLAGLAPLLSSGARIIDARPSLPWPGEANVSVASVVLARGIEATPRLAGREVSIIDSRLRADPERPCPPRRADNRGRSFQGTIVRGEGFVLPRAEGERLLQTHPEYADVLVPFIGCDEVNSSPTHDYRRMVIDFGDRDLEQAQHYEELFAIVRTRVHPVRAATRQAESREQWWRFWNRRRGLYRSIAGRPRCLVTGIISRYVMFSFQPVDGRVYSHKLCVFAHDDDAHFGLLQSRVHEAWARWTSSRRGGQSINYSSTDAFETFPFPSSSQLGAPSELSGLSLALYEARRRALHELDLGLTALYARLADADERNPLLAELRLAHEEVDRCVLRAYGFDDIAVPRWHDRRPAFAATIVDRLLELALAAGPNGGADPTQPRAHGPRHSRDR